MESSQEFRDVFQSLRTGSFHCSSADQVRHISFALKKAARLVHHSKYKFAINLSMQQEIEFFRDKLQPNLTILWESPITHVIPSTTTATAFGDSCLEGAGGYSIDKASGGTLTSPRRSSIGHFYSNPTTKTDRSSPSTSSSSLL